MNNKSQSGKSRNSRYKKKHDKREQSAKCEPRADQPDGKVEDQKGRNDISWYTRNPELLIAAGQFPYPYRPGMTVNLTPILTPDGSSPASLEWKIPGVMSLTWVPSLGISSSPTDPASVIGKQIYARVRAAYSGALDADAPDFMMYLMALDSIYSYIASLKRIFRILNAYSPNNYILPDGLLQALRLSVEDIQNLRANKTLLWQHINTLVLQTRKFKCPALMDVMNRHYWMSDNVYTDADTINAQFYVFAPQAFFMFKMQPLADNSGNDGPGLAYFDPYTYNLGVALHGKVDLLYNAGIAMIDALVAWDEAYTINGYLERAYADVPSFSIDELVGNEVFSPTYSTEFLPQIENSYACIPDTQWAVHMSETYVTQNPEDNSVVSANQFYITGAGDTGGVGWVNGLKTIKPTVSIHADMPTAADTVIATRLRPIVDYVREGTAEANFRWYANVASGSEVPLSWRIWYFAGGDGTFASFIVNMPQMWSNNSTTLSSIRPLLTMSQFDWHPIVWVCGRDNNGNMNSAVPFGDVHNLTVVDDATMINLHRVCLFSEFNAFGPN